MWRSADTPEPVFTVGWGDADPDFTWVQSGRILDDGGAVVGDFGSGTVFRLGPDGSVVDSWGRKGQGPGVFELVETQAGNTYRAIYTVRFKGVIYVLHAFQKKSPKGIKTAQVDVDLVARRLKVAQQDYETRYGKSNR